MTDCRRVGGAHRRLRCILTAVRLCPNKIGIVDSALRIRSMSKGEADTLRQFNASQNLMPRNIVKPTSQKKGHGGRPSVEDSARLTGHIVDTATSLFLQSGFEAVSIDEIAAEARISKRTFYSRFSSKADLFTAVVVRFVETRIHLLEDVSVDEGSLADRLEAVASAILRIVTQPDMIALDRMVTAEASRFSELGRILYDFAAPRAIGKIERILEQARIDGDIRAIDAHHAAEHFLFAVIVGPMRLVALEVEGGRLSGKRLKRLQASVRLFLDGIGERR